MLALSLQVLELHFGDFGGELPANLSASLPDLRVLNLSKNRITSLPDLSQLQFLEELYLGLASPKCIVLHVPFASLTLLFCDTTPGFNLLNVLPILPNSLKRLNARDNHLESMACSFPPSVEWLSLRSNPLLQGFSVAMNLPVCQYIDLTYCSELVLDQNLFRTFASLAVASQLDLAGCRRLPKELQRSIPTALVVFGLVRDRHVQAFVAAPPPHEATGSLGRSASDASDDAEDTDCHSEVAAGAGAGKDSEEVAALDSQAAPARTAKRRKTHTMAVARKSTTDST